MFTITLSYMDMERSGTTGPEKENYSLGQRQGMIRRCTYTSEERRFYVPLTLCLTRTRLHGVITQRPQYESLAWKTSCFVYYTPGFLFLVFNTWQCQSHKLQEGKKNIFSFNHEWRHLGAGGCCAPAPQFEVKKVQIQ